MNSTSVVFADLIGKTLQRIDLSEAQDEIRFVTSQGDIFLMYHSQDCCESVGIESIVGDLSDLIGVPIVRAEEATSDIAPEGAAKPEYPPESETWTFYKLATRKGYVDIRWWGTSNGYYSEGVDFRLLPEKDFIDVQVRDVREIAGPGSAA